MLAFFPTPMKFFAFETNSTELQMPSYKFWIKKVKIKKISLCEIKIYVNEFISNATCDPLENTRKAKLF